MKAVITCAAHPKDFQLTIELVKKNKKGESINYAIRQYAPSEVIALLIRFGASINSETPKLILYFYSKRRGLIDIKENRNIKEKILNTRIKSFEKQEDFLSEKLEKIREEVMREVKK